MAASSLGFHFALEPLATKTFTLTTTVNLNAPTAYDGTLPDNRGSNFITTTLPLTPTPDLLNVVRIASMITTDTNLTIMHGVSQPMLFH